MANCEKGVYSCMRKLVRGSVVVMLLALMLGLQASAATVTTIDFWKGGSDPVAVNFFDGLKEVFMKAHPDIKVNIQYIPWDKMHDQLLIAQVGGTPPDAAYMAGFWLSEFAAMGALAPIDGLLGSAEGKELLDDLVPAAKEGITYSGRIYGVPIAFSTIAVYYRSDWLKEAGIKQLPDTWEGFKEAAIKMTTKDRYGFGLAGSNYRETTMFWLPFLWQAGGEVLDATGSAARFADSAGIEATTFYVDLFKKYHATQPGAPEHNRVDSQTLFLTGKVGITTTGPWLMRMLASQAPNIPYVVGPYPSYRKSATLATTDVAVIFERSRNKAAAWEWLKFITNKENALGWAKVNMLVPYRKSLLDDVAFSGSNWKPFISQAMTAKTYPQIPEWPQIDYEISTAIQKSLLGEDTVKALKDAEKRANEILSKGKR
jgi:multiple sugar transport system substrate-binding protein